MLIAAELATRAGISPKAVRAQRLATFGDHEHGSRWVLTEQEAVDFLDQLARGGSAVTLPIEGDQLQRWDEKARTRTWSSTCATKSLVKEASGSGLSVSPVAVAAASAGVVLVFGAVAGPAGECVVEHLVGLVVGDVRVVLVVVVVEGA